jgi:hypothetical protein
MEEKITKDYLTPVSVIIAGILISVSVFYRTKLDSESLILQNSGQVSEKIVKSALEEKVIPTDGVILPIRWGDLGIKMISVGVIDKDKLYTLYARRGGLGLEEKKLLEDIYEGEIKINEENSGFLLNLFWALGLGTKNDILERGPMGARGNGVGNLASTGGWTLARDDSMQHFSRHPLVVLTPEQQVLVDKVSRGIYRPCCGNSTYFPDCNHGMAMLGLLELMASQGVSEQDMWDTALAVNSYWFPDTYLTIATYMKNKGIDWKDVNSQEILGINYSSAQGYQKIASQVVRPQEQRGGNGCGVDTEGSAASQRQQSGCGI